MLCKTAQKAQANRKVAEQGINTLSLGHKELKTVKGNAGNDSSRDAGVFISEVIMANT